jgi:hypothetical protein
MTKKTFTIIGNCQISLISYLLSNKSFMETYDYISIFEVHIVNQSDIDYIYKILNDIDLLIIQPINNNYKNIENFGTYNIISKTKPSCKIILFPSLHLKFYYPFSSYIINKKTHELLQTPTHYHDINLLNLCKIHKSFDTIIDEFKKLIYDESYKDISFVNDIANSSIDELIKREHLYSSFIPEDRKNITSIIISSDFIINNYKKQLLFYSMNHPSKHLFHYICNQMLKILDIPLEPYPESIDPLLYAEVPILYRFLEKIVDFDISKIPVILCNKIVSIEEYVRIYYEVYSKLDLSEY